MAKRVLTPEEGAELNQLYKEHPVNVQRAGEMLAKHGMESPEFAESDGISTRSWKRIRELLGIAHLPWMAM